MPHEYKQRDRGQGFLPHQADGLEVHEVKNLGSDADIVLLDPEARWIMGEDTLHMATDWSAYEGIEITGKIRKVFSRGELIIDGEACLGTPGRGRYLHRRLDV